MKIRHIYISPEHNYFGHHGGPSGKAETVSVAEARLVAGKGIEGDRFFGWKDDYKGQVTFFSAEVYEELRATLPGGAERSPAVFRRNLITEGQDLNALIGAEFEVQGVRFLGMCECSPCYWMDEAFAPGAEAALRGRGGLRAKVLTDGVLRTDS